MYLLPFLKDGEHVVKIDKVIYDKNGKIPFLKIFFINDYGYIPHKIVINRNTYIIRKILFNSVELSEYDYYNNLEGKVLIIEVEGVYYSDDLITEKFRYIVKRFKPLKESNYL